MYLGEKECAQADQTLRVHFGRFEEDALAQLEHILLWRLQCSRVCLEKLNASLPSKSMIFLKFHKRWTCRSTIFICCKEGERSAALGMDISILHGIVNSLKR